MLFKLARQAEAVHHRIVSTMERRIEGERLRQVRARLANRGRKGGCGKLVERGERRERLQSLGDLRRKDHRLAELRTAVDDAVADRLDRRLKLALEPGQQVENDLAFLCAPHRRRRRQRYALGVPSLDPEIDGSMA